MTADRAAHRAQGRARAGRSRSPAPRTPRRSSPSRVVRAEPNGRDAGTVRALDLKNLPLADAPFAFPAGATETEVALRRCRSRSATPSPASRSSARARPAPSRFSTSAASAAASGSSSAARPTRRSRSCRRPTTSQRALGALSPKCARAAAPWPMRSSQLLDEQVSMLVLADVGALDRETLAQGRGLRRARRPAPALRRLAACRRQRRPRAGAAAPRRPQPRRHAVLGHARAPSRRSPRESPFFGLASRTISASAARFSPSPTATSPRKTWAALADGTPIVTAEQARRGPDRALPRHRRHDLVEPAALRPVRRHAAPDRRRSPAPPTTSAPRRATPPPRRSRRGARSTASASSSRRPPTARAGRARPTPSARPTSIRRASTARSIRASRSTRSRPATSSRRSTSRRSTRASRRSPARRPIDLRAPLLTLALLLLLARHARLALARAAISPNLFGRAAPGGRGGGDRSGGARAAASRADARAHAQERRCRRCPRGQPAIRARRPASPMWSPATRRSTRPARPGSPA